MLFRSVAMKVFRRLPRDGTAEVEVSRYLTEVAHYANVPRYLGHGAFIAGDGSATPIVLAQDFVVGQGDGWTVVTDFLKRELETLLLNPDAAGPGPYALYEAFLVGIATLGRRIAELHAALARGLTVAFAPEAMP